MPYRENSATPLFCTGGSQGTFQFFLVRDLRHFGCERTDIHLRLLVAATCSGKDGVQTILVFWNHA